jgi:ABC-type antimicrobial peptide transport system permease subunit
MVLTFLGIAIGVCVGRSLSGLVRGQLIGIPASEPAAFVTGSVILAVVAIMASAFPAWKASRVDPMRALRFQ